MTDPNIPEDTAPSKLRRAEARVTRELADEDIIRAEDRFKKFRTVHKQGYFDAKLERIIEHPDGNVTYVVRASAWKIKGSGDPDATAYAQGSTRDRNEVIAAAPLESADTIARSRALRNLGILPAPRKTKTT